MKTHDACRNELLHVIVGYMRQVDALWEQLKQPAPAGAAGAGPNTAAAKPAQSRGFNLAALCRPITRPNVKEDKNRVRSIYSWFSGRLIGCLLLP